MTCLNLASSSMLFYMKLVVTILLLAAIGSCYTVSQTAQYQHKKAKSKARVERHATAIKRQPVITTMYSYRVNPDGRWEWLPPTPTPPPSTPTPLPKAKAESF